MTRNLEPIEPNEAVQMYLDDISGDLSPNSVQAKKYQLRFFVEWCEGDGGITNLNDLSGRDFTRFKNWRGENINKVTLRTNLSTVRTFIEFCEMIDAVPIDTHEKVNVPKLDKGENVRKTFLGRETADKILDHLGTFEYASFDHVLFLLLWKCGMRMGALHGIDVGDFDYEDEKIELHHRPNGGTRLKNDEYGERVVTIDTETAGIVQDYIDYIRYPVEDEYGREPLLTSKNGRMDKMQLNRHLYRATTPCEVGLECPAGRDPLDCEFTGSMTRIIKCDHNTRPHDVRRGSITHWLKNDVPEKIVSDRMDVTTKTLDRHYDKRTEEEKAETRRSYLADV